MQRNPAAYGMPPNLLSADAFNEALEGRPVRSTLTQLAQHGLVSSAQGHILVCGDNGRAGAEDRSVCVQIGLEQDDAISPKVPGELMAHYYIKFKTMVGLITAPTHASLPDLIMLLGALCSLSLSRASSLCSCAC